MCHNETNTLDKFFEKYLDRGFNRDEYTLAFQELAWRGCVDDASGKIQRTSVGEQARAEIEAETERLLFAPWLCVNESELDELARLTGQLRDGLRAPVDQKYQK